MYPRRSSRPTNKFPYFRNFESLIFKNFKYLLCNQDSESEIGYSGAYRICILRILVNRRVTVRAATQLWGRVLVVNWASPSAIRSEGVGERRERKEESAQRCRGIISFIGYKIKAYPKFRRSRAVAFSGFPGPPLTCVNRRPMHKTSLSVCSSQWNVRVQKNCRSLTNTG